MKRIFSFVLVFAICISFIKLSPTVKAAELGDVNLDGEVTTADATLALKIAAKQLKPTTSQKKWADYDGDSIISTADVRLILYAAGGIAVDFETQLRESGFPQSYIEPLMNLHEKYPEWVFTPFITGLDFSAAVRGERTPHNKQLISSDAKSSFKCSCSSCYGVMQEVGGWYSASEEAVRYYLDPRNFFNAEYIFQFESTAYDSSQTIETVESIIKNTWMYNSNITYLDASGNTRTYKENGSPVKYSHAIMRAAQDSGMSAYYLASKIVQEVGSASASNAGGSKGNAEPYRGIYNYYNIGALTGASDGLRYANGNMKTSKSAGIYKTASTATKLCTASSGTELYYMGTSGNYYKVRVKVSGTTYTGYVLKSATSINTSYGRPWDNPFKTIYYGAQYIHDSFGETQFTSYLQKFNVNPESNNLFDHEYMANVRGAAQESSHTYQAYKDCNLLSAKKVFSIPVFNNMTADSTGSTVTAPKIPSSLTVTAKTSSSVSLKWNKVSCTSYQIYRSDSLSGGYELIASTTANTYTNSALIPGVSYMYKIRACSTADDLYVYSGYSNAVKATTSGTTIKQYGIVNVQDLLNLRDGPGMDYDVITTLPAGKRVYIISTSNGWHKVKYSTGSKVITGYVSAEFIIVKDVASAQSCPYTEPTSTVYEGASGNDAGWVQWHLAQLGYLSMSGVDCAFGNGTKNAVIAFQEDYNLEADGIVGSGTRSALKKAVNS